MTLDEIEQGIARLSAEDRARLRAWLAQFDAGGAEPKADTEPKSSAEPAIVTTNSQAIRPSRRKNLVRCGRRVARLWAAGDHVNPAAHARGAEPVPRGRHARVGTP